MSDPSFSKTYKRADGEMVGNDYGWVTDMEFFDDNDEPVELVEEAWERTSVRRFWHLPVVGGGCESEDCDEDAEAWLQVDGEWARVCEACRATTC